MSTIISLLIAVIIAGLIVYVVFWALDYIGLPAPFDKIARVLVVVLILLFLIQKFLPLI